MTHHTYLILIRPATGPAYHARCTCDGQPIAALVGQALLGDAAGSVLVRLEQMHPAMTDDEINDYVIYELAEGIRAHIEAERQAWGQVFQLAVRGMQKTVARSIARDIMTQPMPSTPKPCGSEFLARKQRSKK